MAVLKWQYQNWFYGNEKLRIQNGNLRNQCLNQPTSEKLPLSIDENQQRSTTRQCSESERLWGT